MFNDIFYFVNQNERKRLKDELVDQTGKSIIICKRMKNEENSFRETIEISTNTSQLIKSLDKESGQFDKLVLDRPYEVLVDRL